MVGAASCGSSLSRSQSRSSPAAQCRTSPTIGPAWASHTFRYAIMSPGIRSDQSVIPAVPAWFSTIWAGAEKPAYVIQHTHVRWRCYLSNALTPCTAAGSLRFQISPIHLASVRSKVFSNRHPGSHDKRRKQRVFLYSWLALATGKFSELWCASSIALCTNRIGLIFRNQKSASTFLFQDFFWMGLSLPNTFYGQLRKICCLPCQFNKYHTPKFAKSYTQICQILEKTYKYTCNNPSIPRLLFSQPRKCVLSASHEPPGLIMTAHMTHNNGRYIRAGYGGKCDNVVKSYSG